MIWYSYWIGHDGDVIWLNRTWWGYDIWYSYWLGGGQHRDREYWILACCPSSALNESSWWNRKRERTNERRLFFLLASTHNQPTHQTIHQATKDAAASISLSSTMVHTFFCMLPLASTACCYVHSSFLQLLVVVSLLMMVMNYFHSPSRFLLCFCIRLRSSPSNSSSLLPYAASL